jgi:hypothetical protein
MKMSSEKSQETARVAKFLTPEPKDLTKRAVEQELTRIRPQFGFTESELRSLRQPRRKRPA